MNPTASYRGRRVLVLGASGFIGRWVARGLSRAGAELTLAVRNASAFAAVAERYGIRGRADLVDLEQPGSATRLVAASQPEVVFNLSGYGVDRGERDPGRARRINTEVVGELLEALPRTPAAAWPGLRLVHAGSALEYGETVANLDETAAARPTTDYGRSKLAATELITRVASSGNLAAVCARLFTVYGPGEHPGRLLPALLSAVATDASVPLTAGDQQRDFTYVEDVAEGLLRLGLLPAATYPVVNLATGKLCQVKDFVLMAARVLHIPEDRLGFGQLPARPDDMRHAAVPVERLRALLQWIPNTAIASGVRKTFEFARASRPPLAEGDRDGV